MRNICIYIYIERYEVSWIELIKARKDEIYMLDSNSNSDSNSNPDFDSHVVCSYCFQRSCCDYYHCNFSSFPIFIPRSSSSYHTSHITHHISPSMLWSEAERKGWIKYFGTYWRMPCGGIYLGKWYRIVWCGAWVHWMDGWMDRWTSYLYEDLDMRDQVNCVDVDVDRWTWWGGWNFRCYSILGGMDGEERRYVCM